MSRSRTLALVVSTVAAACLVTAGIVVVSTHTATAESGTTAAVIASPRIRAERSDELRHTPEQVVAGPLGTGERAGAVTFAYAGDSITARPDSWLHVLESDPDLHAVGGYAHSGYRSDQVLDEIAPVSGADVLVVELGTNDVNQAVPTSRTIANVDAVVAKVGAEHVLVVAGPPSDRTSSLWGADRRAGQLVLSRALARDAAAHGWSYVDPFRAVRTADGAYEPGTTPDGIHPTAAANVGIARVFAAGIEAAAR